MLKQHYSVAELCIGAGGQAIGLEQAGLEHAFGIDNDKDACTTVRHNRPHWDIMQGDVKSLDGKMLRGIDVLAGGIPCPPFSIAGQQKGQDDERDLFPSVIRLISESNPAVVLIENVPGFASRRFDSYRKNIFSQIENLGYTIHNTILNAADFGVPQLRPRFVMVALKSSIKAPFLWPAPFLHRLTVAESICDLMGGDGWSGVSEWYEKAQSIAPTLVGGSKKHGGADLGPTRAKAAWAKLGIDGKGIADSPPSHSTPTHTMPRLTNAMAARIQGFPDIWHFTGRKTSVYRQIGNAFPPPIATAIGEAIIDTLSQPRKLGWKSNLHINTLEKTPA